MSLIPIARGAGTHAITLAATAVIAVHAIDDSFVQPQPGTAAADHLTGGLSAVALLGAIAVMLPRLRAGARAALTMLLGYFGLLAGSEAAYYTVAAEPSGDDYTGLLSLVAGVLLLAMGARELWRSRRGGDRRLWRYSRRGLLLVASYLVAMIVLVPLGIAHGGSHIASTDVPGDLGVAHEDVTFTSSDGVTLSGWYIPSRNGAAVITLGLGRRGPMPHDRMLARHGYGVLAFDPRGWGASEGDPNVYGWRGDRDILAAAAFLAARPEVRAGSIGGLGLSVGGEMMITAAARSTALAAVVSEGAGERSWREFTEGASGWDWQEAPTYAVLTTSLAVISGGGPPPGLTGLAARVAPRPLFLIYGERGQQQERTLNPRYAAAAGPTATLWEVPGSGHTGGIETAAAEYERRVIGFFDASLR